MAELKNPRHEAFAPPRPRWQQVAAIPEEKFSAYIQTNEEKGKELATAGVPGAVVRRGAPAAERDGIELQARAIAGAVSSSGALAAFN